MAQLLVRQLDEDVKTALQLRAKAHGRSTEEEAREILRSVVRTDQRSPEPLGSTISARFKKLGLKGDIQELRGHEVRSANLN